MKKRKAQSQIITTVLIILLVLAAIVIVWTVVNNLIKSGTSDVNIAQFTLKGEIKSSTLTDSDQNLSIKIQRGAGSGEVEGIQLILEDENEDTIIYKNTTLSLEELETRTIELDSTQFSELTNFTKIQKIDLYFLIINDDGSESFTRPLDSKKI